jgi:hypothetical protein
MSSHTHILHFGDQTADAGPFLKALVEKSKTSPALGRFLAETVNALRLEAAQLPEHERCLLPVFHSAVDLVENQGDPCMRVVLSTVLLCLAQLGDFIACVSIFFSASCQPPAKPWSLVWPDVCPCIFSRRLGFYGPRFPGHGVDM